MNKKDFKVSTFISLLKSTKPSVLMLTIGIFGSLITTATNLALPLIAKNFIDTDILQAINKRIIIFVILILIFRIVLDTTSNYLLAKTGQQMVANLREQMWSKIIHLPVPYFDENPSGELVSRIVNDTNVIQQIMTNYFAQFISSLLTIIGVTILLFRMDWQMTLLMLVSIPLMLGIIFQLGKRMSRIARKTQDEVARFSGDIQQTLSEIRLMKASTAEEMEQNKGKHGINKLYSLGLKEAKILAVLNPLIFIIVMSVLLIVFGYGGVRVTSGEMSVGSLIAFIMFLFQLMPPILTFMQFFTQIQRAAGATNRITKILSLEEEDKQTKQNIHNKETSINFSDVNFSYEENKQILKDINFSAFPGEKIAFVGPSGSGKTTIFSLIERFYLPDSGDIYIGKIPLEDISLDLWRQQIGYVSQESAMMAGTVRENLCYGLPNKEKILDEKIWEALEMAYADQFVKDFPEELDTPVGERGIKLSGGQRQRINIARAFLRNPKILMLDEATSSIDSQSEKIVQQALERLMVGRTTLIIAHRLSTIVDADEILFVENGEITGKGTHTELIHTHSLYKTFAQQQLT